MGIADLGTAFMALGAAYLLGAITEYVAHAIHHGRKHQ